MQVATHSGQEQEQEPSSWEAQVSMWIDGEGDVRLQGLDTPHGRQVWDTYHLIGDVLRSEDLAIRPSDLFHARIAKAVDAQPSIVAPGHSHKHVAVRRGLSGLAVAAAMATVVWVALPYFSSTGPASTGTRVVAAANDVAGSAETGDTNEQDTGLRDYLDAHRQIAGASPVRQASFDLGTSR